MNTVKMKRSTIPGKVPTTVQLTAAELAVNTNDKKLFFGTGTEVVEVANVGDFVKKTGDSMTGSLSLPKDATKGILVDNQYAWIDIIGDVSPRTSGVKAAKFENFIGQVGGYTHTSSSAGDLLYHMPHDYAPGTDLFIHVHWGHNGTNIAGTFKIIFWATYANRSETLGAVFTTPIPLTLQLDGLNITDTPRYKHQVDEIPLSIYGGSANLLDTSKLEVDGLIALHYAIDTIPSISSSDVSDHPYIFTIDLHMQSTNVGTISRTPNFYV